MKGTKMRMWLFHPFGMFRAFSTNVADSLAMRPRGARIAEWWYAHTPDDWRNFFY
jgi:hypothetical protein